MRPTLEDVARAAGVSRATVSRVVNNQPGVAPPVREWVRGVIAETGYQPHLGARALVSGQADVVDLVIVDDDPRALSANPHYSRVISGVVEVLARKEVQLRVKLVTHAGTGKLLTDNARPLGTLLVNVHADLAAQLRKSGRVVSMGRSAPRVPFFEPDNAAGVGLAVRHLFDSGRRKFAAVHGPADNPCAVDRRTGYLAAMAAVGSEPVSMEGDFTRPTALRLARALLLEHPDVDAVFAACDMTASAVLQALAESGRRVPDDVAVVGFDDSVLASSASVPLTSVASPVERLAASATMVLLEPVIHGVGHARVPVGLTVRRSSTAV